MKTKLSALSMMTVGMALVLGPAAALAHGGGGGGAHGGMGAGPGIGAAGGMSGGMSGGMRGDMSGGMGASMRGADLGGMNGSAGGAIGRAGDERGMDANTAVNSEATESHGVNAGSSARADVDANRTTPAAAHADTDADKTMPGGSARADALQLASTMHSINQTAFDERRQLLKSVNMRLKSSRAELRTIQGNARDLRADARAKFQADLQQVKTGSAALKAAIKGTKDADDATWTARREALANAYQHYADAMAKLEVDERSGQ